jgi:hypothetical protein
MGAYFKVMELNKDVDGAGVSGLWNPTGEGATANTAEQVDMHCLPFLVSGANNSIGLGRANTDYHASHQPALYNSTKIGTAQVRQIDYTDGTPGNAGETDTNRERYNFYVYNMQFAAVSNTIAGQSFDFIHSQEAANDPEGIYKVVLETSNTSITDTVIGESSDIDPNGQSLTAKTGTVAVSQNSNTITGSGTSFSTEFFVNDIITVSGLPSSGARTTTKIVSITSDTVMTANSQLNSGTAVSGKSVYNETIYRASHSTDSKQLILRQGSDINDAYNGATVTLNSETRKIDDYDGQSNTAFLNVAFSVNASTADTYSLNFGIKDIESFSNVATPSTTITVNKTTNIDIEGRVAALDPASNTKLYDSGTNN